MISIEEELCKLTALSQRSNEDRQAFLRRLMRAVHKLTNQEWERLTTEAKLWTNACARAEQKKEPLPDHPGAHDCNVPAVTWDQLDWSGVEFIDG